MSKEKKTVEKTTDFYYTTNDMAKFLIGKTPIEGSVLDAGSGRNKVWYNNLQEPKFECEFERGQDYYKWEQRVDWVVGNPPWRFDGKNQIWPWMEKASEIADKGFAFLLNHKVFNTITPNRLGKFEDKGFYLQKIVIVQDKRWFGRYYYMIFSKEENSFLEWSKNNF